MEPKTGSRSHREIANLIVEMICDRKMSVGDKLSDSAIAAQLGVSRTPVRAAFRLLEKEGILVAQPNRGFFLATNWDELVGRRIEVPISSEDELYMQIVQAQMASKIDLSFNQSDLLKNFSVNRILLNKTMTRMEQEGTVVKNKGHGWTFFSGINSEEARRESYDYRRVVEPSIMRLSSFVVDEVALNRLKDEHERLLSLGEAITDDISRLFELDAEFHRTIAEFGNNQFFLQAVTNINRLRRLMEYNTYGDFARVKGWLQEHLQMIETLSSKDVGKAAQLMKKHLDRAYQSRPNSHYFSAPKDV